MDYYNCSAVKSNELLIPGTTWVNHKGITLTQRVKYFMILLPDILEKTKYRTENKEISGCQSFWVGGGATIKGYLKEVWGALELFCILILVVVIQIYLSLWCWKQLRIKNDFLMLNKILNAENADVKRNKRSPYISTNLDCIISCSLQMALSHRFGTDF